MTVRIMKAAFTRFLLLVLSSFVTSAQSNGPLDLLRQEFVASVRRRTDFQPIPTSVAGRVAAVDESRRSLYESIAQRQTDASLLMGKYIESVTIDDGQSQVKAVCSVFEQDSRPRVTPGESVTMSGLFIGAILPGAVELIKCSFPSDRPPNTTVTPDPGVPLPGERAAQSVVSRNAGGGVSTAT